MKVYFISICGTGVGNLAILLKDLGHDVRGSEVSLNYFYPPISDLLKKKNIPVTLSFDPSQITPDLDLVIMGGAALIHDHNNPQVQKAKELGLKLISYANGVGQFVAKSNNIEIVGNHGKTTTTALMAHSFKECGEDASYFLGGEAIGFESTIHSGASQWSVCEGDEHPSLDQEPGGKFLYHKPKHLVFTSADWDHKNVFTTEESYLDGFRDLLKILPEDGIINACIDGKNVLEVIDSVGKNQIHFYTIHEYKNLLDPSEIDAKSISLKIQQNLKKLSRLNPKVLEQTQRIYYVDRLNYVWKNDLTKFGVKYLDVKTGEHKDIGIFETPLIGQLGVENSLAVISTMHLHGFDIEKLKKAIVSFAGVKRKFELIYNGDYKVINDHAHSPIKIESSIKSVRTKFPYAKIFAIFHVNQSGLKEERTFKQLRKVFNLANYVLIPRVTPDPQSKKQLFGKDYKELIQESAGEAKFLKPGCVFYTPVITQMKSVLDNNLSRNDIILIMSSGDVRELIDLTKNLRITK